MLNLNLMILMMTQNPKIVKHVDDDENIKLYVECVNFNLFEVVL